MAAASVDRLVLAEHDVLEVAIERLERIAVVARHILGGDARDLGDDLLDFGLADGLFCFDFGRIFCAAPASSITSIALSGR